MYASQCFVMISTASLGVSVSAAAVCNMLSRMIPSRPSLGGEYCLFSVKEVAY